MSKKGKALGSDLFPTQGSIKFKHRIKKLKPLRDNVLVRDMDFSGRQLSSGIILLGDDGKTAGIRPRWCCVYAVGPDQTDYVEGQWILIEHGRWSRGLEVEVDGEEFTLRRIDPKCVLLVSDTEPENDDTLSTAVHAERKER